MISEKSGFALRFNIGDEEWILAVSASSPVLAQRNFPIAVFIGGCGYEQLPEKPAALS